MADENRSADRCIQYASITDIGMRRANNQDAFNTMVADDHEYWEKRGHLFVVADGMGAHAAGELASKLAADGIILSYTKLLDTSPHEALRQAIIEANAKIHEKGQTDAGFQGMGTTCSSLLLVPQGAICGHVGDSRVYRLRRGMLDQLTFDHSLVWEMRAAGKVSGEDSEINLPKNIITRSLGPNKNVQVDLEGPFAVAPGDVFLLCSDGLTGPVKDQELGAIIGSLPPDQAVRVLVDLANLRGGPDNITATVVRVDGSPVATIDVDDEDVDGSRTGRILWAISAVCLIAAAGMFMLEARIPGIRTPSILCGMVAVVCAIVAVLQRFDNAEPIEDGAPPIPILGRGPHRTYNCEPNRAIASELGRVCRELRETADGVGLNVDWDHFAEIERAAESAIAEQNYEQAIRHHCRGISSVVATMKRHRKNDQPSDSHIDLF
ncbi:MAG: protein phosphatase 2C domain-containing protein [Pirellulales bacterium]